MSYSRNTQKLLDHPQAVAGMVRRIALAAGDAIMDHYDPSGYHGDTQFKEDNSPVTPADFAANDIICRGLLESFPEIPIISEESISDLDRARLKDTAHYWLVDPLDGTKEFRKGARDFTVNIALIHDDQPVLGVVYAPAHEEGFAGWMGDDRGALRWRDDQMADIDISVRSVPREGMVFLSSQTQKFSPFTENLMEQVKMSRHIRRSSSIKYCEIAAGRADLTAVTRDICFWDTAAGDAVIRAAGGAVWDLSGAPARYNRAAEGLVNPGLIACGDADYVLPVVHELQSFLK